jgi:DNA-3-methyladenine glycosylase
MALKDQTFRHRPKIQPLLRDELPVPAALLARWLIGKTVVREHPHGRIAGRIVETEAYVVGDPSSHAFRGQTARNASMFLERGHAYIYLLYGCWFALNVTAGRAGRGSGVLLRALEPLQGRLIMEANRPAVPLRDLARGPGRLGTALGITRTLNAQDLCSGKGPVWLGNEIRPRGRIGVSRRIGISIETHRPLRFFEKDNPYVSGERA